ncbi:MAG TPA: SRPBCC family protein [Pirellulales bacterium]|nr:SRPBCC family protein [Pirellulales bacterium]
MVNSTTDRIEKSIEINAPVARVWRALADYKEFGEWFGVNLESPFVPGQPTRGQKMRTGYEHLTVEMVAVKMEPERLFSYHWHPYAIDPAVDYSQEPCTLVEFTLEKTATGTLLTVTETGFDAIPAERRAEAFRLHNEGWTMQVECVANYVSQTT